MRVPHCRVSGIIGREIAFVMMLPYRWNERLLMGGNGGFAGSIETAVFGETANGYATVATNTGHEANGITARWALNEPERQVNYGSVVVHRTIEVAKAITRSFYGRDAHYSYFYGCSNGGRQALIEAERYPEDFSGIVAGAPAMHLSVMAGVFLKNVREDVPTPAYYTHPVITRRTSISSRGKYSTPATRSTACATASSPILASVTSGSRPSVHVLPTVQPPTA